MVLQYLAYDTHLNDHVNSNRTLNESRVRKYICRVGTKSALRRIGHLLEYWCRKINVFRRDLACCRERCRRKTHVAAGRDGNETFHTVRHAILPILQSIRNMVFGKRDTPKRPLLREHN